MNEIQTLLFKTNALKIANENKPFWYTSGTIGPFYINTHYLYGGEETANELLSFIDKNINSLTFTKELEKRVLSFYNENSLFKNVINTFLNHLKTIKEFNETDYISGGERRDWFFSVIISLLSGKKHLYLYKDLRVFYNGEIISNINGESVFHICDLITQASSFKRNWIPAIQSINGKIIYIASIVDRDEGGSDFLMEQGIKIFKMITIDNEFLNEALKNNFINEKQLEQIIDFKNNPEAFGKNFLQKNKNFIIESLKNEKDKLKVLRCINENPYKINFNELEINT